MGPIYRLIEKGLPGQAHGVRAPNRSCPTVQRVYGAERPSRAQVEARVGSISEELALERWQAVYVLVYELGRPVEIYFEGVSGD